MEEEEEMGVVREVGGKPAGSGLTEAEEGKSHPCTEGVCEEWQMLQLGK